MTNENNKSDFELQMEQLYMWKLLEEKCRKNGDRRTPALIFNVGEYAVLKSKAIIRYMKEFTLHDSVHMFNMLHIIEKLLSVDIMDSLSIPDLMLIFLSVFLHDIGMCPDETSIQIWMGKIDTSQEQNKYLKEEYVRFSRFEKTYVSYLKEIEELKEEEMEESINLIEEYIVSEYIRETHAVRAKEYIAKDWGGKITYGDTDLTSDLANICFSHNEDYKYVLQLEHLKLCGYNTYACIPFIATLLRLADIIDFDPKRAPRILFEHLSIRNAVSVQEWKKHLAISAWTFTKKSLIYAAECEHPATELSVRHFCDLIDNELRNASHVITNLHAGELDDVLGRYKKVQFPLQVDRSRIGAKKNIITNKPLYRYHETAFSLSKNQIIDLLMGTQLYDSPDVALRELVQNSIDACMLRKKVCESYGILYEPRILIYYYQHEGRDYLSVVDNGMGMNQEIIDNYYTNIGCSYYKSNDFFDMTSKLNISFSPISKFGIGILACFMVCNEMQVETRRVIDKYTYDNPISVKIEGYDSLFVIRDGEKEDLGTDTTLKLRKNHPWEKMNREQFIGCVQSTIKNPPFPIHINYEDVDMYVYEKNDKQQESDLQKIKKLWTVAPNIKRIDFRIEVPEYGFSGLASVAYIVQDNKPAKEIRAHSHTVVIDGEEYSLSSSYTYDDYGIFKSSDSLELTDENMVKITSNTSTSMPSYAEVSLRGISIPCNFFSDFSNSRQEAIINFPLPTLLVLDIYDKTELNLNTSRTNVVYDKKWILFEKRIVLTLCKKLQMKLKKTEWKSLQRIIIEKLTNPELKKIVETMSIE